MPVTRDYSLSGTLARKMDATVLSGALAKSVTDAALLADRALRVRHPDLGNTPLDPKNPAHRKLLLEKAHLVAEQARPLIWLNQIVAMLDQDRDDIPRQFLLAWMTVESDGDVTSKTSVPERGYFQINWASGEAQEQLGLSYSQFLSLTTDRAYSIQTGIKLVKRYRDYVKKNYTAVPYGSALFWRLTKARHGASGLLRDTMGRLSKKSGPITWDAVAAELSSTRMGVRVVNNVNEVVTYASGFKPLTDLIPSASVSHEFERHHTTTTACAGAPVTSDPDNTVAVPPFDATERGNLIEVMTPKRNAAAIEWNKKAHRGSASGVNPDLIRSQLANYVDFPAVSQAIDAFNRRNASNTIPISDSSVFVEAIHQFQAKCFNDASSTDGKAGGATLDSLGLIHRTALNPVAQVNTKAQDTLRGLGAKVCNLTNKELSAGNWFNHMVQPSFLGETFTNGIHLILARKLRTAERYLLSLSKYAGLTPVKLRAALGIREQHKGARPSNTDGSMHNYGLAVDINYATNPRVVGNPARTTGQTAVREVMNRATSLISGVTSTFNSAFLDGLASNTTLTTRQIHQVLSQRNSELMAYLALGQNDGLLMNALAAAQTRAKPAGLFLNGESLKDAAIRWRRQIRTDLATLSNEKSTFWMDDSSRDPLRGFLDLNVDLVFALRDKACLAWGATDFGPGASGDMMHFDCRVDQLGFEIAQASGGDVSAFTKKFHPCVAVAAGGAQREVGSDSNTSKSQTSTPANPWTFPSKTLGRKVAVYVSSTARGAKDVEMLVFVHGLSNVCKADEPIDFIKGSFKLGSLVDAASRPMVLVVPWFDNNAQRTELGSPDTLNAVLEEVRGEVKKFSGLTAAPSVKRLILSGHSGAFYFFDALAIARDKGGMSSGSLKSLTDVWAIDTTYSSPVADWLGWLTSNKNLTISMACRSGKETDENGKKTTVKTSDHGSDFIDAAKKSKGRMTVTPVAADDIGHCAMPKRFLPKFLANLPALTTSSASHEMEFEEYAFALS
ncbi:MAG TPA: M15 family metallopeptidase [Bryobacteraceae bacterium]